MIRIVPLLKLNNLVKLLPRCYCSAVLRGLTEPGLTQEKSAVTFYAKLFGIPYYKMVNLMPENKYLLDLNREEVIKITQYFYYLGSKQNDFLENLQIFQSSYLVLCNRTEIYRECGFVSPHDLSLLAKYIIIMNKSVKVLKTNKFIPMDLDLGNRLIKIANEDLSIELNNDISLKTYRKHVLNEILKFRLEMTKKDIDKMWKSYVRMQHKSFKSILTMLDLLENTIGLTKRKIKTNLYLLYGDPVNLRKYLKIFDKIAGLDIIEVLKIRPKLIMSNAESTQLILSYLRKYDIPESGLINCFELLTLSPNTVLQRLMELKKIKEFDVLSSHPRVLRLVHHLNKAKIRLEYLKQLKLKCISLNVLSSSSFAFEKFAIDGCDRTKGVDTVTFLSKQLNKPNKEIREIMIRHYHWLSVPSMRVKITLERLQNKGYKIEDIYENIYILFYPISRIDEKLSILDEVKESGSIHADLNTDISKATPSQILQLCLYMIEKDCHFTCDGIWEEPAPHNDVQVSHSLEVPKMLTKEYKFGNKPASHKFSPFSS